MALTQGDELVRGTVTRLIADLGHAPSAMMVADTLQLSVEEVISSYRRLDDHHSLLLHPHAPELWVVHPFSLYAGSCWVSTPAQGYWANCLYCALGIAACLDSDATITTRLGGEEETVVVEVQDGSLHTGSELLFHLSTPVARWWDNVVFACASFQPFRAQADINRWCERHAYPQGHVMTVAELWPFARSWYGDYLRKPWRKRTLEQNLAIFQQHGLPEPFWSAA